RMVRVAINGALPKDIGTGFAEIQEWEFDATCHPVIPAWFGRHFADGGWAPTQLLAYLTELGILKSLKVREAIISLKTQKRCLVAREQGPGLLCQRQFHPGQRGRWKKANKEVGDGPWGRSTT
ncbi:MAG: hypothetical protein AB2556_25355, partial [Candidatus Thiodiazotropha sp.]